MAKKLLAAFKRSCTKIKEFTKSFLAKSIVKFQNVDDILKMSKGGVGFLLHKDLSMTINSQQGYGVCILGSACNFFQRLLEKNKQSIPIITWLTREELGEKRALYEEEKSIDSPKQCIESQLVENDGKIHELFLKSPPYSPDLAPSSFYLFKKMCKDLDEEVIGDAEVAEVYCSTRKLWKCQRNIEGNCVNKYCQILSKTFLMGAEVEGISIQINNL